ncbi:M10 family metallopeptidase [Sphingobium sp.]|uniref:M10 family metallopeptidase n=1 Tax=Sphingobium sp. TaxID=1912891 RepID=UPI002BFFEF46|nr:M10 family metallopeptidase C-terminal domain-containing protein [Sphingobium sp.]HUD91334.1 M10 family metallopeptidase C-terminal domain-containing protein [Sphingobium sp.]
MLKVTGAGPTKLSSSQGASASVNPSSFSLNNASDLWSLVGNAQSRSDMLLLYPEEAPTPPNMGSSANGINENGSASTTAAQAGTGDAKIDGILSGVKWAGAITYADTDSAADYQSGYFSDGDGNGISAQNEGFLQFSALQMRAMHTALDQSAYTQPLAATAFSVEAFTNLGISYAGSGVSTATIRGANSDDPGTAYAYYPDNSIYGGDTFFGNYYDTVIGGLYSLKTPVAGNYAWHTMFHELGHSLGLKHGQETGGPSNVALPTAWDSIEFSVMTYRSYVGAPLSGYSYEDWGGPQSFMMLDILALQTMYGADYTVNSGNTVYTWSPTTGETYIDGGLAIDPGGNRIFATVWDGGGVDTYDLSNYTTNLTLDLNPGGYSVFSEAQLAYLGDNGSSVYARGNIFNALLYQGNKASLIENANGGSGADSITGNDANNVLRGNAGNDIINGGSGDDTLSGGDGNDLISGGDGNDQLRGGAGNDIFDGGSGRDLIYGEDGNDTLKIVSGWGGGYGEIFVGGAGIDMFDFTGASGLNGYVNLTDGEFWNINTLSGPISLASVENVNAGAGADNIIGSGEVNVLNGNDGNDVIYGLAGNDTLFGGEGADVLDGGEGVDVMNGGNGNDIYYVNTASDNVIESSAAGGNDTLFTTVTYSLTGRLIEIATLTGTSNSSLTGNNFAQTINGNDANNSLKGLGGNDILNGNGGNDILEGGDGNDTMNGGAGDDTVRYIDATAGVTVSLAVSGAQATGGAGSDTLISIEHLSGSAFHDILGGNAGNNNLKGGSGNDQLNGGGGNDVLDGGNGDDILNGGSGADTLTGGGGKDIFAFLNGLGGGNVDTVTDYSVADDTFRLNSAAFGGLAIGSLSAAAFRIGSAAGDASDRIIYNSATGALLFDADGTGATAAVQFANISTGLAMTNAEFVIV